MEWWQWSPLAKGGSAPEGDSQAPVWLCTLLLRLETREQMLLEYQMEGILQKKINKPSHTQPAKVQEGSSKSVPKSKKDSAEPPEKNALPDK